VYRVVAAVVSTREEAEDLTQEAFVRALRHLEGYQPADGTDGSFRPYLITVARNLVRDRWRAEQRAPTAATDMTGMIQLPDARPGPEATALADLERAAAGLAGLPPDYQRVLRLRLLEGRPTAEAAAVLGRSPDAVRQLQHRALVALHRSLSGFIADGEDHG
jgi:RNA polymerase sigma-70 factor (ECF subfamily)